MKENITFGISPFLFEPPKGSGGGGGRGSSTTTSLPPDWRSWGRSVRGHEAVPGMNDYYIPRPSGFTPEQPKVSGGTNPSKPKP